MILFFSANNKRNINHVTFSLKRQKKKDKEKDDGSIHMCGQPTSFYM